MSDIQRRDELACENPLMLLDEVIWAVIRKHLPLNDFERLSVLSRPLNLIIRRMMTDTLCGIMRRRMKLVRVAYVIENPNAGTPNNTANHNNNIITTSNPTGRIIMKRNTRRNRLKPRMLFQTNWSRETMHRLEHQATDVNCDCK